MIVFKLQVGKEHVNLTQMCPPADEYTLISLGERDQFSSVQEIANYGREILMQAAETPGVEVNSRCHIIIGQVNQATLLILLMIIAAFKNSSAWWFQSSTHSYVDFNSFTAEGLDFARTYKKRDERIDIFEMYNNRS